MDQFKNNKGMTLTELLIGSTIGAIITLAVGNAFASSIRWQLLSFQKIQARSNANQFTNQFVSWGRIAENCVPVDATHTMTLECEVEFIQGNIEPLAIAFAPNVLT